MNKYNYRCEDMSNLVFLEHVNLLIPDQRLATAFYVSALGLTRDPYLMTGVNNMWINVGRSQIHLPHGAAQRLRGHVGLMIGKRPSLIDRLREAQPVLAETAYAWKEYPDRVQVTCPWGNRYDCLDPDMCDASHPWTGLDLGIAYVQLDVPVGASAPIAAFYREMFNASVEERNGNGMRQAVVEVGTHQQLIYAETPAARADYDGHHIQLYVADFARPYARLEQRQLTYGQEPHQYRFARLIDPANGEHCFELEHEIRSVRHPLFARPLVNRNPDQSNRHYMKGSDQRFGEF